jgi:hypothetical protein
MAILEGLRTLRRVVEAARPPAPTPLGTIRP